MERLGLKSIKAQSNLAVFSSVLKQQDITRNELAENTGLSLMTVGKTVDMLIANKALSERKEETSAVGRKASLLSINSTARKILVIDLSEKSFTFNVLNMDLSAAFQGNGWRYNEAAAYEDNLKLFLLSIKEELRVQNLCLEEFIGVGISAPGPYFMERDKIINKRITQLMGVKVKALVGKYFPELDIFIDEDVKLAAKYHIQMSDDYSEKVVFYAYIGVGVGGAISIDGNIMRGAFSFAGDFGQFKMNSGQTLEAIISTKAFVEKIPEVSRERCEMYTVEELSGIYKENAAARDVLGEIAVNLARALYNIAWIINPHVIIIETPYTSIEPEFISMVSEQLTAQFDENQSGLIPAITVSNHSIKDAYKGAALTLIEKWISKL